MKSIELKIAGMSCGHCVMAVKKALSALPGVGIEAVEVGRAVVTIDEAVTGEGALADAIAGAGYDLAGVREAGAPEGRA